MEITRKANIMIGRRGQRILSLIIGNRVHRLFVRYRVLHLGDFGPIAVLIVSIGRAHIRSLCVGLAVIVWVRSFGLKLVKVIERVKMVLSSFQHLRL